MPMYDYRCPNTQCNRKVERLVSFNEADKQVCDVCDGLLERQISAPRVKFGESFVKNFRDDVSDPGAPYKGFYYDDEYVKNKEEWHKERGLEEEL